MIKIFERNGFCVMKKCISKVCFFTVLMFLILDSSFSQTKKADILDKEIQLDRQNASLLEICSILAASNNVSIGIEWSSKSEMRNREILDVKSGTLRQILDSLVRQEPDYDWEIRNDVVNFYPVRQRDKVLNELLNTKITNFRIRNDVVNQRIVDDFNKLKELQKFQKDQNVIINFWYLSSIEGDLNQKTIGTEFANLNLKEILNKIVKQNHHKLWEIDYSQSTKGIIIINF